VARRAGRLADARAYLRETVELAGPVGALNNLAAVRRNRDYPRAAQALDEALSTDRALRDPHPDQPKRWASFVCAASRGPGGTGLAGNTAGIRIGKGLCPRPDEHGTLEG
jgi:hypothetical protein